MKMGNFEYVGKVKVGNKERFDKEHIGIKKPFPVAVYFIRIRNFWLLLPLKFVA